MVRKSNVRAQKSGGSIQTAELITMFRNGNIARIKNLVEKGDLSVNEAFTWAARMGLLPVIEFLVKNAFDIATLRDDAFKDAAFYGHPEVVRYLLNNGANIHVDNDYALCWAANNGNIEIVKILLEELPEDRRANIHANDDEALRLAARNGHLDVIQCLVENGANVHANKDEALRNVVEIENFKAVKYLADNGANVKANNNEALLDAATKGNVQIFDYLIKKGADIHAGNDRALSLAKTGNHFDVVKYIIKHTQKTHDTAKYNSVQQLDALSTIKERAIREERSFNDSVLQYIGLILRLLDLYDLENKTEKIIGIKTKQLVSKLTDKFGHWMIVLHKDADLKLLCHDVLNPMLSRLLDDDSVNDAAIVHMCQSMNIDKFDLTPDALGIVIQKNSNTFVKVIMQGNDNDLSTRTLQVLNGPLTQHNEIFQLFQKLSCQKIYSNLKEAINNYTVMASYLTAFSVAFLLNMPYTGIIQKSIYNEHVCTFMEAADIWKSYLGYESPSSALNSFYSSLNQDYFEVYSGRNMMYSSSGKAISALKGCYVYLTASTSTSASPSVCFRFVVFKSSPVVYRIKIPKNGMCDVLPIAGISLFKEEKEVLLPIGTKLRVDDVYPCKFNFGSYPYLVVEATVCPKDNQESDIFKKAFGCALGVNKVANVTNSSNDINTNTNTNTNTNSYSNANSSSSSKTGGTPSKKLANSANNLARFHNDIGILTSNELLSIAQYLQKPPSLPHANKNILKSNATRASKRGLTSFYYPAILQSAGK